jgi:hypothetical protein
MLMVHHGAPNLAQNGFKPCFPALQGFPHLFHVRSPVIRRCNAAYLPRRMVQNALDNVGRNSQFGHTCCDRPADVMQGPVSNAGYLVQKSFALGPIAEWCSSGASGEDH